METTRRTFVGCAGAALAASMVPFAATAHAEETAPAGLVGPDVQADEEMGCDIVVMGSGMSGTIAALQAAELGADVVVLEALAVTGGGGRFTEGVGGVDSSLAKEKGIHVDKSDIIHDELEFFNYRVNALCWSDAIETSGESIDWMIANGAEFDGTVDNDRGDGKVSTYHWFKDRVGGYALDPLLQKAESLGARVLLETRGTDLLMEDGKVAGILAQCSDGSTLLVRCGAVIFASGGYGANYDLMIARGCPRVYFDKSNRANQGDALIMAQAAGGVNVAANSALLFSVTVPALDFLEAFALQRFGEALLVNGQGERFVDENCGRNAIGCFLNAISLQSNMYIILTRNTIDLLDTYPVNGTYEGFSQKVVAVCKGEELDLGEKNNVGADASVLGNLLGEELPEQLAFYSETIEGLAEQIGIDPAALVATVARYNELCEQGKDADFGKDSEKMMELDGTEGFFALRIYPGYATSIGGIKTNRNFQVVDELGEPIPGLYAAGCDGIMAYRETYTVEVPGSCNMHNVHSGRRAAQHAVQMMG